MTTSKWICAAAASALGTASCTVSGSAYAAFIQTEVRGNVALDASPPGGTALGTIQVDLDDELGIDEPYPSLLVGGKLVTDFGRISVSAFRYDESGSGTLARDFGDIGAGAAVESELRFDNIKAFWSWDLLEWGPLRIAPGVGADVFLLETSVRSVSPVSAFEEIDVTAPVPMVFLESELDLGPVVAIVEAGGMDVHLEDGDGTYWDLDGRVALRLGDQLEVFAGYRYIHLEADGVVDGQRFDADIDVTGWFLGGAIGF